VARHELDLPADGTVRWRRCRTCRRWVLAADDAVLLVLEPEPLTLADQARSLVRGEALYELRKRGRLTWAVWLNERRHAPRVLAGTAGQTVVREHPHRSLDAPGPPQDRAGRRVGHPETTSDEADTVPF
jgi:hypothetical protein